MECIHSLGFLPQFFNLPIFVYSQVYERSAIEEHFDTYSDQSLVRSRFTNESMGTRLITSTKTEALIVTLLENDLIIGELNEAWKKKDEAKKIVESSPLSAEKGDRPPLYEWTTRFSRGRPDLLGLVYEGPWRWVSSRNRIG